MISNSAILFDKFIGNDCHASDPYILTEKKLKKLELESLQVYSVERNPILYSGFDFSSSIRVVLN